MKWYLKVLRQYADFSGRARRKEYWMFVLFNVIFVLAANAVAMRTPTVGGLLMLLYALAVFIPSLAVVVRRLHDTGKSGWWIFISLVPIIGSIWLLVLMCTEGDAGGNQYGEDPKGREGQFAPQLSTYRLSNDCALLHAYRPGSVKGAMISYDLHLNDDVIFRAKNNSKTTVELTRPGQQTLWAKTEARTILPIDVQLGQEYYVRCKIGIGFFAGRPKLEIVDNQTGKAEFDKIR